MTEYFTERQLDRIQGRVKDKGKNEGVPCSELQPEYTELIDRGQGRCVFDAGQTVIKVARNKDGLEQNENAKILGSRVEKTGKHKDKIAKIYDSSSNNVVIEQEKVEDVPGRTEDGLLPEDEAEEFGEELGQLQNDLDMNCSDSTKQENLGMKNGELVLKDLGKCHTTVPKPEHDW